MKFLLRAKKCLEDESGVTTVEIILVLVDICLIY